MTRITKTALVLLYLLQLVVAFREQLAHAYGYAVAVATGQAHEQHPDGKSGGVEERPRDGPAPQILSPPAPRERLTVGYVALLHGAILHVIHDKHDHVHPPHDHDRGKDRLPRFRRKDAREFLVCNRWQEIRSLRPTRNRRRPCRRAAKGPRESGGL